MCIGFGLSWMFICTIRVSENVVSPLYHCFVMSRKIWPVFFLSSLLLLLVLFCQIFKLLFFFSFFFQPDALTVSLWACVYVFVYAHCTHSHRAGNCGNAIAMTIKSGKIVVRHTSNKMNMKHIAILFTHVIQIMNDFMRICAAPKTIETEKDHVHSAQWKLVISNKLPAHAHNNNQ